MPSGLPVPPRAARMPPPGAFGAYTLEAHDALRWQEPLATLQVREEDCQEAAGVQELAATWLEHVSIQFSCLLMAFSMLFPCFFMFVPCFSLDFSSFFHGFSWHFILYSPSPGPAHAPGAFAAADPVRRPEHLLHGCVVRHAVVRVPLAAVGEHLRRQVARQLVAAQQVEDALQQVPVTLPPLPYIRKARG